MSFSIYAPQSWWSDSVKFLSLSSEMSSDMSNNSSFLSCTLITVTEENEVFLETESMMSTTFIKEDDLEVEESGQCLIPTQRLANCMKSMPQDSNVKFIYDSESGNITIESDSSSSVTFNTESYPIYSDDAIPKATRTIPNKSSKIVLSGKDFPHKYKLAASMSKSLDKDNLAGQDPLSGCAVDITENGLQMFSLSVSSSETFMESDTIKVVDNIPLILTSPDISIPRISAFSNHDEITFAIKNNKRFYLKSDNVVMEVATLNIGTMKNLLTMDVITNVLKPAWKQRVVSVKVPSGEFFESLTRVSTVDAEKVVLKTQDNEMILSGMASGKELFSQKIPITTEWLDDGDHVIEANITIASIKKISSAVSKGENLVFDISCKENGEPWAMIVYHGDEYDPENPHDFFMMSLL